MTTLSARQFEFRRIAVAQDERHILQRPLIDHYGTVDNNDPVNVTV